MFDWLRPHPPESNNSPKELERYLPTLMQMAAGSERFKNLTGQDIQASWLKLPSEEKDGILLLAKLQEFLSQHTQFRSYEEQLSLIQRDARRKGGEQSRFGEYSRKILEVSREMQQAGKIRSFSYISQANHTDLERNLDESGVDWIWQRPQDHAFVLAQSGTRPGNARDKIRHLERKYGPKFAAYNFIGTFPVLNDTKEMLSHDELKGRIESILNSTRGFGANVLDSAFPLR